jgi:hypothetical protein
MEELNTRMRAMQITGCLLPLRTRKKILAISLRFYDTPSDLPQQHRQFRLFQSLQYLVHWQHQHLLKSRSRAFKEALGYISRQEASRQRLSNFEPPHQHSRLCRMPD